MANRSYDAEYEPRPGESAGEEELRYRRFLRALGAAGLGNPERAEACAVAVLCTLEQRLTGPEARDLNFELPWALRDLLRRCELHPRARPEKIGRAEFLARVAEQLEVDEVQAEAITRTVFASARAMISEKEAGDVASQLPPDLEPLWAPAS